MNLGDSPIAAKGPDRLALWVLGCVISLAILTGTLTPSTGWQRAKGRVWCVLCDEGSAADATGNVLLFLPLGFVAALTGIGGRRMLPLAAAFSVGIELSQVVIPGRDPNLGDVLFNSAGAMLGWMLARTRPGCGFGEQMVRILRVGIVPPEAMRAWLTVGSAAVVSGLLVVTCLLLTHDFPDGSYFADGRFLDSTSGPLHLGGNPRENDFYVGVLDEVKVFSRALTAEAIRADMTVSLADSASAEGLVAAYDFERDSGTAIVDVSGHQHHGVASTAVHVDGRFGKGLRFSGRAEGLVSIPPARELDLTNAMTLVAWVFPTGPQRTWGNVLGKDRGAYFLSAGSSAGSLCAAAGGLFGGRIETVYAASLLAMNAWSHLAITYDGARFVLYVNGEQTSTIQRWSSAQVLAASVGSRRLDVNGTRTRVDVGSELRKGGPILLRFGEGSAPGPLAPVVRIRDERTRNILVIASDSSDLVLRTRVVGTRLGLMPPALRLRSILEPASSRRVSVNVARDANRYCVTSAGRTECVGLTAASGWALFIDSLAPPLWLERLYNAAWIALLFVLPGFFASRLGATFIAAVLMGVSLGAVPEWLGLASVQSHGFIAAVSAFAVGSGLRQLVDRTFEHGASSRSGGQKAFER